MKVIVALALLAVAYGQTLEQWPIKTQQSMVNPLLMTEQGIKNINWNGDWNLLTLQELIQHPLFQYYYQLPLFRQHFSHPLFQIYLTTPHFQNYWTYPVFKTFFENTVLFYKYIYPQVFTNTFQTPVVTPVSWMNKMFPTNTPTFNNYDEIIRKVLGVEDFQKWNMQGMNMDRMKNINWMLNWNKPEEMTEVKTDIKIPNIQMTPPMIVNPKFWNEKMMMEETPIETMKDALIKEDLVKDPMVLTDDLVKKFYLEKMMNKNIPLNKFMNKMTSEDLLLLQNKMEELIPTRIRRHATYAQVTPTTYNTLNKNVLPYYNVPWNRPLYYAQPTYTNTLTTPWATPYQYTNTVGTPLQYNTVPLTYTQTPYTYTQTPYNYIIPQTVV